MASSSNGRRASSSKQNSAGKARVISVKRTETLPRTVNAAADRPEPAVSPPMDAPMEPLATSVAGSTKRAHRPQKTKSVTPRKKTTRASGRTSNKLDEPAEPESPAAVETEMIVEASQIVEETTVVAVPLARTPPVPVAPEPHHAKRALVTVASQLLSTLLRWTGVRR